MSTDPAMLYVVRRPHFCDGSVGLNTRKGIPFIVVDSDVPKSEWPVILWHEMVHLIRSAGGYDQSEDSVEAAAVKLAACCPEIVEWVNLR